jgi:DNA-3-methyladenine glycosylase I
LEGFQAGLSWRTILNKRENFRKAFANFEIDKVARFGPKQVERLLGDAGIVRHRGKIESTINNARRAQELIADVGSLAAYLWGYEPASAGRPKKLTHAELLKMATSPESLALSKDLRSAAGRSVRRRFTPLCRRWVWSTITRRFAVRGGQTSAKGLPAANEAPRSRRITMSPASI